MILSINQPAYLPWLGYFHRICISDLHIVLDHVQFEKNSYVNRNKIINGNEWRWLTIPVQTKGKFGKLNINGLKINNNINWKKKHWVSIQNNYSKTSYFHHYADFFEYVYSKEWMYLADICKEVTNYLLQQLGINTEIKYSSEMTAEGKKNDLIFWKGHVAIGTSQHNLIHAYGPEKKTIRMSIKKTIDKIYKTANLKVIGIRRVS